MEGDNARRDESFGLRVGRGDSVVANVDSGEELLIAEAGLEGALDVRGGGVVGALRERKAVSKDSVDENKGDVRRCGRRCARTSLRPQGRQGRRPVGENARISKRARKRRSEAILTFMQKRSAPMKLRRKAVSSCQGPIRERDDALGPLDNLE